MDCCSKSAEVYHIAYILKQKLEIKYLYNMQIYSSKMKVP